MNTRCALLPRWRSLHCWRLPAVTCRESLLPPTSCSVPLTFSIRLCSTNRTVRAVMAPTASWGRRRPSAIPYIWRLLTTTLCATRSQRAGPVRQCRPLRRARAACSRVKQVDAIVQGMRQRWGNSNVLQGGTAPPYAAKVVRQFAARSGGVHDILRFVSRRRRQGHSKGRLHRESLLSQLDNGPGAADHRDCRASGL